MKQLTKGKLTINTTQMTSNCCNAEIKTHIAYEGTGCYVCTKCGKACDQMTSNEEKIMPEVEVTASASFEDLLKLPDGQAVVVDVAKIRQALHSQKERIVDGLYVSWDTAGCSNNWVVQFWKRTKDGQNILLTQLDKNSDEGGMFNLSDLKTKIEEGI